MWCGWRDRLCTISSFHLPQSTDIPPTPPPPPPPCFTRSTYKSPVHVPRAPPRDGRRHTAAVTESSVTSPGYEDTSSVRERGRCLASRWCGMRHEQPPNYAAVPLGRNTWEEQLSQPPPPPPPPGAAPRVSRSGQAGMGTGSAGATQKSLDQRLSVNKVSVSVNLSERIVRD